MVKPVANPEFVAIATAQFAAVGLLPRKKGQSMGRDFADGLMLFEGVLPAGWSMQLLGSGPGYGEHGQLISYDHIAVTDAQGYVHPAYRRVGAGGQFCICRERQYVGRQG
jgi:hypothetical protein